MRSQQAKSTLQQALIIPIDEQRLGVGQPLSRVACGSDHLARFAAPFPEVGIIDVGDDDCLSQAQPFPDDFFGSRSVRQSRRSTNSIS
jgi:hypothetical protein